MDMLSVVALLLLSVVLQGVSSFLDRVLGGDVQYKPLKDGPPALTPVEASKEGSKK